MDRILPGFLMAGVLLANALAGRAQTTPDAAGVEFFEAKVRPVLAEHCYSCHSEKAEKLKGDLYLDTKMGVMRGGASGPVVVPGDAEKSLLIKAVRYHDENLQMPPKGKKLSDEQIADLESWVKMGAPDPRMEENKTLAEAAAKREGHWAFKPVILPTIPTVTLGEVRNEIDAFVLARLEKEGMKPSPRTDKRTLMRRASFDLLGLPPDREEMERFLADDSEKAFEKVVDQMLASPQYGERWARHWLDVARYADTKGYVFEEERRYPYSYTYRDYVIQAFNNDVPYDRFIKEQLAADQLELGDDKRPLAAMGFLTLGRRFLNNQPDIIDDRIDVVTRGFMGLTVVCARCHDHEFDPIPTKDYYSLYGIFNSSHEPGDKPLLGNASLPKEYPEYLEERKKREAEMENFKKEKQAAVLSELRARAADYLLAAYDTQKLEDKGKAEALAKERKLDPPTVRKWIEFLNKRKETDDMVLKPWFAFTALAETNFAAEAGSLRERFSKNDSSAPVNEAIAKAFGATEVPQSIKEVAKRYEVVFSETEKAWMELMKKDPGAERLADEGQEQVRRLFVGEGAPLPANDEEFRRLYDVPVGQRLRALKRKLEELDATHAGAPPKGMVMLDNNNPGNSKVFIRGSIHNQGEEAPRQMPEIVAGKERKQFTKGSGRLELAEGIASKDNPLTARVMVNRVWLGHFGTGLVGTPSDFGVRSDAPSHPELLDYLAYRFMNEGWSLKKLHRLIMLSATYQQESEDNAEYAVKDPNNALLWRMNRKRLEFEPFRDTLLAASGKLDRKQYGQPVEITTKPFSTRRSVYAFIERQNLPGLFRTFDFASPDSTSPQRYNTTVPQQALFMINSPFVNEQARGIMERAEVKSAARTADKIKALYRVTVQRDPNEEELEMGESFVAEQLKLPPPELPVSAWQYGYGALETNSHKVLRFTALPHFTGTAWQGSGKLPDDKLGWLLLNAEGGHPGEGLENVVIRRWTAPGDMVISIEGSLRHESKEGDGVRGRVISSRSGEIAMFVVADRKTSAKIERLEVKKGETIDFVVDSYQNLNSDSFAWAPRIKMIMEAGNAEKAWAAKEEFSGPKELVMPLNAWEKFAQVLLMSNELAFVD